MQKRFLLFLVGCMGTRGALAQTAKVIPLEYLPWMGSVALIPMIGFLQIFFTGARSTGVEVFGAKIWWNALRPFHALMQGLFAYSAIQQKAQAWKFLAADVTIGLVFFLAHHWIAGDFAKMF